MASPTQNAADLAKSLEQVLVQYERAMHELGWTMVDVRAKDTLRALVAQAETAEAKWVAARLMGDKWMERAEAAEARLAQTQDTLRQIGERQIASVRDAFFMQKVARTALTGEGT